MNLGPLIEHHARRMADQLVDSDVTATRRFWRLRLGATQAEADDPRPFDVVMAGRK